MLDFLPQIIVFLIFLWFYKKMKDYHSPYKLVMIVGKKGAGKSTDIVKRNMYYRKRGWTTYCTEYVPDSYHIDFKDIGFTELEKHSVIFIDEIGIIWHARDFKNFDKKVREWFKLQRHRKIIVYCYSQSFDMDKSLRDLCDELWIMRKWFGLFSVQRKVVKDIKVVEATAEAESRIADNLRILPPIPKFCIRCTYIPKYAKYFDSFDAPALRDQAYQYLIPKFFHCSFKLQRKLFKYELRDTMRFIQTRYLTMRYRKGWIRGL